MHKVATIAVVVAAIVAGAAHAAETVAPTNGTTPTDDSFLTKLFIDVKGFPSDGYGFVQLLMVGAVYGYILMVGSNMIKDGSELLLLVPSLAGVVGSIVLPVLGAVPDGAIVIFSGMGPDAQKQITVGIGALAGSTVMLLTVPWVLCLFGGRVNINADGTYNYVRDKSNPEWKKIDPPNRFRGAGVRCGSLIGYNAKVMLVTLVSFLIVQIPAMVKHCAKTDTIEECNSPPVAALIGAIVSILLFCFYLWDQARIANNDEAKEGKIDELRRKALDKGLMSISGLFPVDEIRDRDGDIAIEKDSKRFKNFLRPFFRKYDVDGNEELSVEELELLLRDMGEKPTKQQVEDIFNKVDTDRSGAISFAEFTEMMCDILENASSLRPTSSVGSIHVGEQQPLLNKESSREVGGKEKKDEAEAEDEDEDGEEEPEVPEDLVHLSPKQQQTRILIRSFATMGAGVFLVLFFSDPMVDVLSDLGDRINVSPFFVAFVLAPLASNASELIAAYSYSQKKTEKSMTISFSSLIGAACMNNTFCLSLFLFLVYAKGLKWEFTAETVCIIAVELAMFCIAIRREHPMWTAVLVGSFYPASIALVKAMEAAGLD